MGFGGKGKMMQMMMQMMGGGGGGGGARGKFGKGGGKRGGKGGGTGEGRKRTDSHEDEDPSGSCRVLVMGFDFGTTDEQFEGHMKQAGPIHTVHWISKGKAIVVYKKKASAAKAQALDNTTIDGNERYINVKTGSE